MNPQTHGKIERWHSAMNTVVKLENYYSPGDLTNRLEEFVNGIMNHCKT